MEFSTTENVMLNLEITSKTLSTCSSSLNLLENNKNSVIEGSSLNITNSTIKDSTYDDPANWPFIISQNLRTGIVKLGPKRIININFPSHLTDLSTNEK